MPALPGHQRTSLPEPYYDHDGITIYHGDCREILPMMTADTALTDPPFGVGLAANRPPGMRKHSGSTYTFGEDSPDYVVSVVVPVIRELIARCARVVVTSGTRCLFKYPEPHTIWALYWPNSPSRGRWSAFNCWSPVLCYGKGPTRVGSLPDTFVTNEQAEANGHPCPKPLVVWKRLLAAVSDPGDVVIDPFMGSGTTLVAAKQLGHRAIGIEIEERYCEIAVRRLAQGVLSLNP